MRTYGRYLLSGLILLGMIQSGNVFSQELKIATIDLSRAFDEYHKTKESDRILEGKGQAKKTERDKKVEDIKKLKSEFDLLSEEGKREKQAVIDQKIQELQEFDRETRASLRGERDQMVQEILKEIDQVVQAYGKENGYTMILNDRVLLYKGETLDVTEDIIGRLNQGKGEKKR